MAESGKTVRGLPSLPALPKFDRIGLVEANDLEDRNAASSHRFTLLSPVKEAPSIDETQTSVETSTLAAHFVVQQSREGAQRQGRCFVPQVRGEAAKKAALSGVPTPLRLRRTHSSSHSSDSGGPEPLGRAEAAVLNIAPPNPKVVDDLLLVTPGTCSSRQERRQVRKLCEQLQRHGHARGNSAGWGSSRPSSSQASSTTVTPSETPLLSAAGGDIYSARGSTCAEPATSSVEVPLALEGAPPADEEMPSEVVIETSAFSSMDGSSQDVEAVCLSSRIMEESRLDESRVTEPRHGNNVLVPVGSSSSLENTDSEEATVAAVSSQTTQLLSGHALSTLPEEVWGVSSQTAELPAVTVLTTMPEEASQQSMLNPLPTPSPNSTVARRSSRGSSVGLRPSLKASSWTGLPVASSLGSPPEERRLLDGQGILSPRQGATQGSFTPLPASTSASTLLRSPRLSRSQQPQRRHSTFSTLSLSPRRRQSSPGAPEQPRQPWVAPSKRQSQVTRDQAQKATALRDSAEALPRGPKQEVETFFRQMCCKEKQINDLADQRMHSPPHRSRRDSASPSLSQSRRGSPEGKKLAIAFRQAFLRSPGGEEADGTSPERPEKRRQGLVSAATEKRRATAASATPKPKQKAAASARSPGRAKPAAASGAAATTGERPSAGPSAARCEALERRQVQGKAQPEREEAVTPLHYQSGNTHGRPVLTQLQLPQVASRQPAADVKVQQPSPRNLFPWAPATKDLPTPRSDPEVFAGISVVSSTLTSSQEPAVMKKASSVDLQVSPPIQTNVQRAPAAALANSPPRASVAAATQQTRIIAYKMPATIPGRASAAVASAAVAAAPAGGRVRVVTFQQDAENMVPKLAHLQKRNDVLSPRPHAATSSAAAFQQVLLSPARACVGTAPSTRFY
eukprot:TRINITY_DN12492_c0_g1_i3.p1 TRINITY_DN12492_c0_g1~~TRINITY_DN12492_c0_g1_i3.p1  ORF type:complete len:923 (-),score=171.34 TRINITY_DN12492_c0_g1_i3:402-3128(-)